jgi:alpha-N-arabinofuranosidase
MKRFWPLALSLTVVVVVGTTVPRAAAPTIAIDASTPAGKVSPLLYGLMTEEIFVGEWGAYETPFEPWNAKSRDEAPTPNLRAAIGDAAWMTEMERNADLIVMHCYAPLLVNVSPGARQWRPDLIGYDALRVYGSPSYHAIKLFATHVGDEILKATAADTNVLVSVTRDSRSRIVYVKLVNPDNVPAAVHLDVTGGALRSTATALTLAGAAQDTNSIDAPERVVPKASQVTGVTSGFRYTIPANGIVVLELGTR